MFNRQKEITLPGTMLMRDVDEFERLVHALAAWKEFESPPITKRDQRLIDNLPDGLRDKLVKHGLLDGKPDIPTVLSLVERFKANRKNVKDSTVTSEKAALQDIIGYFMPNTRVDAITPDVAESFRSWMLEERIPIIKSKATANRRVGKAIQVFNKAKKWGYITVSPFADITAGSSTEGADKRQDCIDYERFIAVFNACADDLELQCILASSYWGGIRVPSEPLAMKFSDIEHVTVNGRKFRVVMIAEESEGTKTGGRPVLILPEWQSCLDALYAKKTPEQEFVYVKYKNGAQIRRAIYRRVERAGIVKPGEKVWEKLFNNLRATRTTYCDNDGMPDALQDILFGNSARVREASYKMRLKGFRTTEAYVEAILPFLSSSAGTENFPTDFPTESPSVSHQNLSLWSMIDDGNSWQDVVEWALKSAGYTDEHARKIVENDKYAHEFYKDIKYCRERVCDWKERKVSLVGMVGSILSYTFKIHYRALRGSVVSKTFLDFDNLDKLTPTGLEPVSQP